MPLVKRETATWMHFSLMSPGASSAAARASPPGRFASNVQRAWSESLESRQHIQGEHRGSRLFCAIGSPLPCVKDLGVIWVARKQIYQKSAVLNPLFPKYPLRVRSPICKQKIIRSLVLTVVRVRTA